jgi:hypothetical protein
MGLAVNIIFTFNNVIYLSCRNTLSHMAVNNVKIFQSTRHIPGCAIAQAVRCWFLMAEAQVQY